MTRINVVDPKLLRTKHLVAEYRELPRVFNLIRNAQNRGESPDDPRNPSQYVLGQGHVRFFYNKARWLVNRQKQLVEECIDRGFMIKHTDPEPLLDGINPEWCGDWEPTQEAIDLNIARINTRGGLKHVETR